MFLTAVRRKSWKNIPGTPAVLQAVCHEAKNLRMRLPRRWKTCGTMMPFARSRSRVAVPTW